MQQKFTPKQIQSFKRAAKANAKATGCAHSKALDDIALRYSFANWSLLIKAANKAATCAPATLPPSVEELIEWFRARHTLAVEESPWDGREGGYQYPVIEDVNEIIDILRDEFPHAVAHDVEAAANELDDGEPWLDPQFMRIRDREGEEERRRDDVVDRATGK